MSCALVAAARIAIPAGGASGAGIIDAAGYAGTVGPRPLSSSIAKILVVCGACGVVGEGEHFPALRSEAGEA